LKRSFLFLILALLALLPASRLLMQDAPTPAAPSLNLTITGVNASEYPTVVVSAEALDQIGQPIFGLGADLWVRRRKLQRRWRISRPSQHHPR